MRMKILATLLGSAYLAGCAYLIDTRDTTVQSCDVFLVGAVAAQQNIRNAQSAEDAARSQRNGLIIVSGYFDCIREVENQTKPIYK